MKIISWTPAGRKATLQILNTYLLRNKQYIDKHIFLQNTTNQEDINFIEEIASQNKDFYEIIKADTNLAPYKNINLFYENLVDKDTLYIKIDDDICWMHHAAIKNLIDFRLSNKDPFLVFPSIINNPICSHLFQRMGMLGTDSGICEWDAFCNTGWRSGKFAQYLHSSFIDLINAGKEENLFFNKWMLWDYIRVSINCIAFFGEDMSKFDGQIDKPHEKARDEAFLTEIKPKEILRPNCICGQSLVSHYSFYTQKRILDETDILQKYLEISKK